MCNNVTIHARLSQVEEEDGRPVFVMEGHVGFPMGVPLDQVKGVHGKGSGVPSPDGGRAFMRLCDFMRPCATVYFSLSPLHLSFSPIFHASFARRLQVLDDLEELRTDLIRPYVTIYIFSLPRLHLSLAHRLQVLDDLEELRNDLGVRVDLKLPPTYSGEAGREGLAGAKSPLRPETRAPSGASAAGCGDTDLGVGGI